MAKESSVRTFIRANVPDISHEAAKAAITYRERRPDIRTPWNYIDAYLRLNMPDPLLAAEIQMRDNTFNGGYNPKFYYVFGRVHDSAIVWSDRKRDKKSLTVEFKGGRGEQYLVIQDKPHPTKAHFISLGIIEDMKPLDGRWLNRGDRKHK